MLVGLILTVSALRMPSPQLEWSLLGKEAAIYASCSTGTQGVNPKPALLRFDRSFDGSLDTEFVPEGKVDSQT